jgi:hypothetical protein
MSLHIGSTAPDFTQESTDGVISFHQWLKAIRPYLRVTPQPNR